MKLYLAGAYTANFDIGGRLYNRLSDGEKAHRNGIRYYLESHHYIHRQTTVDKIRKDGKQVFLDSGAFSAFTKGVEVDMKGYCKYIQKNSDIILHEDGQPLASVLDGIGDPLKTYQNQLAMERLGVRPLPCFHYGEDERYLEWYMERYPYITLGGMVPISTPQLKLWLDRIWDEYLTDSNGRPKLKVHGFGLTTISLMKRYPWYSVDSSSWVQSSSNGSILHPKYGIIPVSEHSPARKMPNMHYDNFAEPYREKIREEVTAAGFDIDRLRTEYISRWTFNMWSYKVLNQEIENTVHEFHAPQPGLF